MASVFELLVPVALVKAYCLPPLALLLTQTVSLLCATARTIVCKFLNEQ